MITKEALDEYSQEEMLLGALPRDLCAKAVIKLEIYPRDPSMFKYNKLRKHVIGKCAAANTLTLLHSEEADMAPGVSPFSVPAAILLPRVPLAVNHLTIPTEETPVPAQATETIPIT